jgi:hypothetical protein
MDIGKAKIDKEMIFSLAGDSLQYIDGSLLLIRIEILYEPN